MIFGRKNTIIALSALALGLTSCGKKKKSSSSDSASSDLTISGSLSLTGESSEGTSSSLALADGFDSSPSVDSFNIEASDLSIFCVTFAFPPVAGTGKVGTDGEFSLSISGGKDASIGCFILNGTTQVGTIVFEDPSEKDLSGSNSSSDKTSFAGNVKFGAIKLDLETGKAVVDLSTIEVEKKVTGSAAALTDFSGTYKITALGLSQPDGYTAPCPAGSQNNDECRGPSEGETVFFKRINGKDVATQADVYGVMAWESKAMFETCGSRLGISYADAKAHAGVDLSGSGVAEGEFTWAAGLGDGWKNPSAMSRGDRPIIKPLVVNGIAGQAEGLYENNGDGAYTGFEFRPANDSKSGCKDTTGKPVRLEPSQWQTMVHNDDRTQIAPGIYSSSSHLPDNSVTCTFVGGRFAKGASATDLALEVDGTFTSLTSNSMTLGRKKPAAALCSSLSDDLEKVRCYADSLWDYAKNNGDKCIKRVNYNWGAKTAAEFVNAGNGPAKAFGEHIFEKFRYDSATSGSFRQEEERFEGIDTGNGWTDCRKIEKMNFALKAKEGSKDLLVEMTQERRNADPKPACIAASGKNQVMKSMFIMSFVE